MKRNSWTWAVLAAAVLAFGVIAALRGWNGPRVAEAMVQPQPPLAPKKKGIVGVYFQRNPNPPGAPFRLEIRSEGRWAMACVMSAWWGTWRKKGEAYEFIGTDDPTGKTPKPGPAPFEFDGHDVVVFGQGANKWIFDRMPTNATYLIPFTGTSIDREPKKGIG